jgi:hypothetical protein
MKKFLVFITVLLSSNYVFSCGYSPYGEDVRYSLFLPEYFNYADFKAFWYNSELFGFDYEYQSQYESNVEDWFCFAKKQVPIDDINECLNTYKLTDISAYSSNKFLQYLYKNKLNNIIQYLITAKKCEDINNFNYEDPWERGEIRKVDVVPFLKKLQQLIEKEKSNYIKRKYAFLTIRVAYYSGDYNLVNSLFKKHFASGKKDYLYYWSLYFNAFKNNNASIDISNIMAYSPEKKYASYFYFNNQFKLESALVNSKTKQEIANVYAYASVQRLEPNLDYLKEIYTNSNKSRILDFLLLREINKIEDWVYTPYYTNYLPSIEFATYWWSESPETVYSTQKLRERSEKDRLYAQQVLDFVNSVDCSKIDNVSLWKAAQIQLLFITRDYETCLQKIDVFVKKYSNEKIVTQIEKIKALCIISNQEVGKAIIKEEVKPIILKYLNDERFLFSLGRELEFRNSLPDAMALIAFGNQKITNSYSDYYSNSVEWQGNRLKASGNLKYFYEYFDYLDFVYSANELQIVINKLNTTVEDDFIKIIYSQLLKDKNYLIDLLGTKYIRENRLMLAEKTFKLLSNDYWQENYNAWERDKYEDYYSFDENPFYDLKHTESFIPHNEKFVVTKLSVTQHLIKYLRYANNPKTNNRDYYYFLVANCYLSMTQYGNSWMMRRYTSTSDYNQGNNESYIDEIEYRNGNQAQKYYYLAYKNAKTDKFKALCLRMEDYSKDNISSKFEKLKKSYPNYFNDLSSCDNLEEFFNSRR